VPVIRRVVLNEEQVSLNALLAEAQTGVTLELVRNGRVVARLQPPTPPRAVRSFSRTRGGL